MANKRQSGPRSRDEQAFLAAYDAARFPHPSVAVDVALVTADAGRLRAVLAQREEHPDKGQWSLPGGLDKVGLGGIFLEQLYTFGRPDRDPRTRVISVAYYALVDAARLAATKLTLGSLRIPWSGEQGWPVEARDEQGRKLMLAFDHADILGLVVQRLRGKLDYAPIGFELLPREFTLRQLQAIHETILGRTLNKDSFRRRLLASGLIEPTGQLEADVTHRPAELYRFIEKRAPRAAAAKKSRPHTSRKE
jgi:8-oxo-dGTP diphosphatase